jgi:type VI secretion system protein ImpA
MLDLTGPLPDISADEPAGPNLEFDSAFAELEREAQGKPEQQYGTTIVAAEDPDWKVVVASAWTLLERTYDLRIMALLAVGRLQREGVQGYAETLGLIRQVLEQRWVQVHPQLDPEDDNDPTLRGNALLGIAHPGRVLRFLRLMPLARSVRAGTVCWRDIAVAHGTIEAEEGTVKMADSVITAAFRESDPAAITALQAALAAAIDHAVAIPAIFDQEAGYGTGPEFTDLIKLLRDMQRMVASFADVAAADTGAEPEDVAGMPMQGGSDGVAAPSRSGVSIASITSVNNRSDAVRLVELAIDYYERNEPSSPLPLLLRRACRLADKGFLDLVRDLAPDGLGQAERIGGVSDS